MDDVRVDRCSLKEALLVGRPQAIKIRAENKAPKSSGSPLVEPVLSSLFGAAECIGRGSNGVHEP